MNHTVSRGHAKISEIILGLPDLAQPFIQPHASVVVLFLILLQWQVTYLPIAIPAIILAGYQEWMLYTQSGISTTRYSVLSLLVPWMSTCIYRLVTSRLRLHKLPGVPHNFLLGHLPTMAKETMRFPTDIHTHVVINHIADKYDLRKYGLFYVDTYPITSEPILAIISPEVAVQVSQAVVYPKHPILKMDFGMVLGARGLVTQEDQQWRDLRTMFSPGFAPGNLLSMVPMIVEEGEVFSSRLSALSSTGGFVQSMDDLVSTLTVDVMGRALLGLRFNSQEKSNPMVTSVIQAGRLAKSASTFSPERLNFWRLLKLKYHCRVSNSKITQALVTKWQELAASPETARNSNVIMDIAMTKYMKKGGNLKDDLTTDFLQIMRDNIKTFIFAGHDTTSAVICYSFHILSLHPEALREIREEHDSILGPDPNEAAKRLTEDPKLANALPFTTAVIREVMRLQNPASSVRKAPNKGATVVGRDGKTYPADNCLVWLVTAAISHDPTIFPSPNEFIPHRFMPEKSEFPPIPKNAFRPFEKGPRDCIGQELAMLEARIVLALTLRKFNFKEAYEELDARLGRKPQVFEMMDKVGRAYQVLWTTAKPKDGLPMWVSERTAS